MKTVLSCIQPTSEMHIGNYFGAVKNWVALQNGERGDYHCIYGVVDLHAMSMPYDPKALYNNTHRMAMELLACGIDPQKSILFIQSLVPEHTELAWICNCVSSYGQLTRMTQFKEKTDQLAEKEGANSFVSTGLFTYPVLQAADILVYKAQYVPVGKDQEQHLELTRNIAERFNYQFGEYFELPNGLYTEIPKVMSLAAPNKKMSKSLGPKHYIGLFEDADSIRKKVASAVTDSGTADPSPTLPEGEGERTREPETGWYHNEQFGVPKHLKMSAGVENLFSIIRACGKTEEMKPLLQQFGEGNLRYKPLKDLAADVLVELTSGLIEKKKALMENPKEVERVIYESSEKARAIARITVEEVRELTGLPKKG